jgi:tRNA 2-selenouridine synthase SelU
METITELNELENKTIACKKMVVDTEVNDIIGIERFYVEYTEDQDELLAIKQRLGLKAYHEIISIWNKL